MHSTRFYLDLVLDLTRSENVSRYQFPSHSGAKSEKEVTASFSREVALREKREVFNCSRPVFLYSAFAFFLIHERKEYFGSKVKIFG